MPAKKQGVVVIGRLYLSLFVNWTSVGSPTKICHSCALSKSFLQHSFIDTFTLHWNMKSWRLWTASFNKLVHHDQVGFAPGMHSWFNIHELINVIRHIELRTKSHVSREAEKAFDKVWHPFVFKTVDKLGIERTLPQHCKDYIWLSLLLLWKELFSELLSLRPLTTQAG